MRIDWNPFVNFVLRHQKVFITTHTRPDGDAIGSMMALAAALEKNGKKVRRVLPSRMPPRYASMDPDKKIEVFEAPGEMFNDCDGVIVVDTGTWSQLDAVGGYLKDHKGERAVIDHHRTQDGIAQLSFVDTTAEACGRLIYEAIQALGMPLTTEMAEYIFVALAMDTGWFRHSTVEPRTMEFAAKLIAAGAKPSNLYERLYEQNTPARMALMGRMLGRLQTTANGKVAYAEVHRGDYPATGAIPLDTEDLIDVVRSLSGVNIAIMFLEHPEGGVKISLRSRGPDVAQIAEQFGGGGHKLAAGATFTEDVATVKQKVLAAVNKAVQ